MTNSLIEEPNTVAIVCFYLLWYQLEIEELVTLTLFFQMYSVFT